MADKPYQRRVDEFLADYTDKFIPTLITGKGTKESPFTNLTGPEAATAPMTKEQLDLEKTKILANSISPDTFNKVFDTMRGERPIPSHDVFTGLGTKEGPRGDQGFLGHPLVKGAAGTLALGGLPFAMALDIGTEALKPVGRLARKITGYDILPENREKLGPLLLETAREAFAPGYHQAMRSFFPRYEGEKPIGPAPTMRTTGVKGPEKTGSILPESTEKAIPSLESMWGIKREGNTFTLPGGEGTMTVGPERFFLGGKEVPAGTPGAVSGDQLARDRILQEAAVGGFGGGGGSALRSYYDVHPEERYLDELSMQNKPIMDSILKSLEQNRAMAQGFGLSSDPRVAEIQRLRASKAIPELTESLAKAGAIPGQTASEFLKNITEGGYKGAMADYYSRMAGTQEAGLPTENFARYAQGMAALKQANAPIQVGADNSLWMGDKWITAPGRSKPAQDLIEGIRRSSMLTDPNTGATMGFSEPAFRGNLRAYVKAGLLTDKDVNPEYLKVSRQEWEAGVLAKAASEKRKIKAGDLDALWKRWNELNPMGY